ncbi:MAG: hypothetical protein ACR2M4_00610 [Actinomycetota bacterium]
MFDGNGDDEEFEIDLKTSGFSGHWSVEGAVLPVWVNKEEPPAQVESDPHEPLSSVLERLGVRIEPQLENRPPPD